MALTQVLNWFNRPFQHNVFVNCLDIWNILDVITCVYIYLYILYIYISFFIIQCKVCATFFPCKHVPHAAYTQLNIIYFYHWFLSTPHSDISMSPEISMCSFPFVDNSSIPCVYRFQLIETCQMLNLPQKKKNITHSINSRCHSKK